jgi:predicted nucleic acid-binding protein
MILVDSSVWIEHQRSSNAELGRLLEEGLVTTHPFVVGELALGSFKNRQAFLGHLMSLPEVMTAADSEVLNLIEAHQLAGLGLGLVDAHLLASALIDRARLFTFDSALDRTARKFGIAWGTAPH